jgi:DNA repair ATPase RecN
MKSVTPIFSDGEEEALDREYRRMANSRRITRNARRSVCRMTGGDGAGELVSRALRELSEITEFDGALSDLASGLADAEGLLGDFNRARRIIWRLSPSPKKSSARLRSVSI